MISRVLGTHYRKWNSLKLNCSPEQLAKIGIDDDMYRMFQCELLLNPLKGDLIRESGGYRKVRMRLTQTGGKSGGARVWYLWLDSVSILILVTAYTKAKRENLEASEKAALKKLSKKLKDHYGS